MEEVGEVIENTKNWKSTEEDEHRIANVPIIHLFNHSLSRTPSD